MNTITVNGTTFTGEMILDAVARTTGFPKLEMRPINFYYKEENGRWSLITQNEWINRKKKAFEREK